MPQDQPFFCTTTGPTSSKMSASMIFATKLPGKLQAFDELPMPDLIRELEKFPGLQDPTH